MLGSKLRLCRRLFICEGNKKAFNSLVSLLLGDTIQKEAFPEKTWASFSALFEQLWEECFGRVLSSESSLSWKPFAPNQSTLETGGVSSRPNSGS